MWFGDEGVGGGRHGYLGSEEGRPCSRGPWSEPTTGPTALTSSCVLPYLPFLFRQIRHEHLRRLFREEREKLADPDSRRAKAEVEALLKRDAP